MTTRVFTAADQEEFARWSGDCNPMHMDALAARRTQAGAPVVHGIHLLIWSLDALLREHAELRAAGHGIRRIRAQFQKFVLVGETVEVKLLSARADGARWVVTVDGGTRCKFSATFAAEIKMANAAGDADDTNSRMLAAPMELEFTELAGRVGTVRMAGQPAAAYLYPAATECLGAMRVAGLATTSTLVGMVCPGLHSIYGELDVEAVAPETAGRTLGYRVAETDERFRTVSMEIEGGGWTGRVEAFLRTPPVGQPGMEALRGRFPSDAFAGVRALIVGGSRGLGELTAKLLATGGAATWITYRSGREDAERVAAEIRSAGGSCRAVQWDAEMAPELLLERLEEMPTEVYYFATPTIFRPQARVYQPERLAQFLRVYVDGFWNLVLAAREKNPAVNFYYPSTVFVSERPAGMTEYAMAKAAGEVLCADIAAHLAPTRVVVTRLPRLATDQTASVTAVETESAADVMTEVIRAMHA